MKMNAGNDSASLRELLDEIAATLERLVVKLDQEFACLTACATERLEQLVANKEALLEELAELESRRRRRLAEGGFPDSLLGMEQLFESCGPMQSEPLRARWRTIVRLIGNARDLGERNAATISLTRGFTERLLSIWRGEDPSHGLYGPQGRPSSLSAGRQIAQA